MPLQSKATPLNVNLDDLILDFNNPRFAELYSGSDDEDDLIDYLLYTEAAEEVAKAIVNAGEFYPDRPLWVLQIGEKYLVKDGNRRCSAVKALQMPGKYNLGLPKTIILELPVLLYNNQLDIDARIVEEHAGNLFRRWERIAKALEVLKLADNDRWEEAQDLDSNPGDLIKLASFYKEAVVYGGDELRQLLRRGRGKTGGKTIIFERLFRDAKLCGYSFKKSPSFRIDVTDSTKFSKYILAMVKYLKDYPLTTTEIIDKVQKEEGFLKKLKDYGFDAYPEPSTESSSGSTTNSLGSESSPTGPTNNFSDSSGISIEASKSNSLDAENSSSNSLGTVTKGSELNSFGESTEINGANNSGNSSNNGSGSSNSQTGSGKGSTKRTPTMKRKGMPAGLNSRIKEYLAIDAKDLPNTKIIMARVTFECILKYIVENTKVNGKTELSKYGYFGNAYKTTSEFTDFTKLKNTFALLIKNTGLRKAFQNFDLDHLHSVVHNYNIHGLSTVATQTNYNLVVLIEFMLQDEADLLSSLDLSKLQ